MTVRWHKNERPPSGTLGRQISWIRTIQSLTANAWRTVDSRKS